jgi:hypothetical protein
MNVKIGPIVVTNADGSGFLTVAGVEYHNLPREFYTAMEAEVLALLAKWNNEDQKMQSAKKQK